MGAGNQGPSATVSVGTDTSVASLGPLDHDQAPVEASHTFLVLTSGSASSSRGRSPLRGVRVSADSFARIPPALPCLGPGEET